VRRSANEGCLSDTAFFLALINPRDQYHRSAVEMNAVLAMPLVTTAWVLLEFANAIAASRARAHFERVLARLRLEPDAEIIAAEPDLFDRGCEFYIAHGDKEWSLTDCISFVIMRDRGLTDALTTDRHFEQAGFKILLSN
jgi:predicted nucleic acid-binding protein